MIVKHRLKRISLSMLVLITCLLMSLVPVEAQSGNDGQISFRTEGEALGLFGALSVSTSALQQPYLETLFSGGLVNVIDGGYAGSDASRIQEQLGSNSIGFNIDGNSEYRVAEDFVIPLGQEWAIEWIKVFAYQTGADPTRPTITSGNFQIWDGPPNLSGSSVIFGDTLTNRLIDLDPANNNEMMGAFRDGNQGCGGLCAVGGSERPIQSVYLSALDDGNGGDWLRLSSGTYWLDWQLVGDADLSGPWVPYQVGNNIIVLGNGLQSTDDGTNWAPMPDAGLPTGVPIEVRYIANDTGKFRRIYPVEDVKTPVNFLRWEHTDQDWYHVTINKIAYPNNIQILDQWYSTQSACRGASCTVAAPLLQNGDYEWIMEAWHANDGLTGRDLTTFNVDVPPVQQIVTAYPPQNPDGMVTSIQFAHDLNTLWYHIYIADENNNEVFNEWYPVGDICSTSSSCIVPLPPIIVTGDYQFWIAGWGPAGFGPYNVQPHRFAVPVLQIPEAITLTDPVDGLMIPAGNYTVVWQSDPNALWYRIVLDKDGQNIKDAWYHAADVCSPFTGACSLPFIGNSQLMPGSYTWTMQAWGVRGFGPISTPNNFSVIAP